jgi:CHASE3 domain sensor protein
MKLLSYFRSSAIAFPLAALAALAMFAISELSYQDATTSLDALGERNSARNHLSLVARNLLDAEAGQRGYLLTNRPDYLVPYRGAQSSLRVSMDWLKNYYGDNPRTTDAMHQLAIAADEKMSELETTIALHDSGVEDAWRDLMLSDIGKEKMERVRALTDQLLAEEATQAAASRKSIYQTLLLNRIGVTAMAAISLLALFMY